jgi:hypothetical protein
MLIVKNAGSFDERAPTPDPDPQHWTKIAGSGSISQRHGSADPDPHQNVMDPQHWFGICIFTVSRPRQSVQHQLSGIRVSPVPLVKDYSGIA